MVFPSTSAVFTAFLTHTSSSIFHSERTIQTPIAPLALPSMPRLEATQCFPVADAAPLYPLAAAPPLYPDADPATLSPVAGSHQDPDTMAWWQTQPDAYAEVLSNCQRPDKALPEFDRWCKSLPGKPVAVAWPAAFDFAFVNYYCHRFAGRNPAGFACLDIRSYANGLARHPDYYGLRERQVRDLAGEVDKAGLREHVAVDDAIEQGRLFMALRRFAAQGAGRG